MTILPKFEPNCFFLIPFLQSIRFFSLVSQEKRQRSTSFTLSSGGIDTADGLAFFVKVDGNKRIDSHFSTPLRNVTSSMATFLVTNKGSDLNLYLLIKFSLKPLLMNNAKNLAALGPLWTLSKQTNTNSSWQCCPITWSLLIQPVILKLLPLHHM